MAPGAASPLLVAVPAVGLAAGLAGVALRRRAPTAAPAAALAAVAAVAGWGLLRIDVLWKPVLPTGLAYGLDRAGTALALALAGAAAVLVVGSGGLILSRAGAESCSGSVLTVCRVRMTPNTAGPRAPPT